MKNRRSPRLQAYDYSSPWWYFITICTKERIHYFWEIKNGEMNYTKSWEFAQEFLKEIPSHFNHVLLDSYIVMPNHIHCLLILRERIPKDDWIVPHVDKAVPLSLQEKHTFSTPTKNDQPWNIPIYPKSWSISSIIWSYKSVCTKHIRKITPSFQRQPRFHDRIIRNEDEYNRIKQYIHTNPEQRKTDIHYNKDKIS